MQQTGTTGTFDTAGLVRRARRMADISQRELAEKCGLSKATVGRLEVGSPVATHVLVRILAEAGLRLQVVDLAGRPVEPMRPDAVRDRGGRLLPALSTPGRSHFWWNRAPFRQRDHDAARPPRATAGGRVDRGAGEVSRRRGTTTRRRLGWSSCLRRVPPWE